MLTILTVIYLTGCFIHLGIMVRDNVQYRGRGKEFTFSLGEMVFIFFLWPLVWAIVIVTELSKYWNR